MLGIHHRKVFCWVSVVVRIILRRHPHIIHMNTGADTSTNIFNKDLTDANSQRLNFKEKDYFKAPPWKVSRKRVLEVRKKNSELRRGVLKSFLCCNSRRTFRGKRDYPSPWLPTLITRCPEVFTLMVQWKGQNKYRRKREEHEYANDEIIIKRRFRSPYSIPGPT